MLASVVSGLLLLGCGKKEAPIEAQPPAAVAETNATQEATAAATQAPIIEPPTDSSGLKTKFTDADKAMKTKDYETAAKALLAVQLSKVPLTEQQGFDQVNRMRQLSRLIAEGSADGDPKAKRAADLLREVQRLRTR
jgi:hypothetical protein